MNKEELTRISREAIELLKEYPALINKDLGLVDEINAKARLEKIIRLFELIVDEYSK